MSYFIRVLGERDAEVTGLQIQEFLEAQEISCRITGKNLQTDDWSQLVVENTSNTPIIVIERERLHEKSSDLLDLREEIQECKPQSAVSWLVEYFSKVKFIFVFQVLKVEEDTEWNTIDMLLFLFSRLADGITHTDLEGFSNKDGALILWQFENNASGVWTVAVLKADGIWQPFQINLENKSHVNTFLKGMKPQDVPELILDDVE